MEYVTYKRVSTEEQNKSGLGIEAQERDLQIFLSNYATADDRVVAAYTESVSGAKADRPELNKALALCRETGATLLVSKLDRLSRSVAYIASLMEDKKLSFKVCQMPNADKFQLHIYAALAEQEREFISKRTKAALAEAKARGTVLGGLREGTNKRNQSMRQRASTFAETLRPTLEAFTEQKLTIRSMAEALNRLGVKTSRGGEWSASSVHNALRRLELA
jgi:DNA invertase Pin-like site-specific DNA recombinase